ncbi:tetratricopeptide repeat protein [Alteromonas sp. CYL-A6]|uniref:tetratricopeptide repeat protein n=1 Tax=Alteromonas nitratireducens TaxID=3390813 RepID=UPI0034B80E34
MLRVIAFCCVLFCCTGHAQQIAAASPSHPVLSSVESCIARAVTCQQIARELQAIQTPHSVAWFRTTYLLMHALWETDRMSIPMDQMQDYASLQRSPPVFAATASTIYAKQLLNAGRREEGEAYAEKAAHLMMSMPDDALTPRRYAEVIVLQQYLQNFDRAQQLIDDAMRRFTNIGKAYAKSDLLTAAGHNAYHLKKWETAQSWYQQAVVANRDEGNLMGASTAFLNLGRAYQADGRFDEAATALQEAIAHQERYSPDTVLRDTYYMQLRLCEVWLAQGKANEASTLFATISRDQLHHYHQHLYDSIGAAFR